MKYTDKFLRLPIKEYHAKNAELTGNAEYFDNYMKINIDEICNYKPSADEDNDNVDCVSVRFKNGDSFYIYLTVKEFESRLNDHYQKTQAQCLTT